MFCLKNNNKNSRYHAALGAAFLSTSMLPSVSHADFNWQVADGVNVNWSNAIRYSAAARVSDRDSDLTANPNLDDGNQNFSTGLISNRLELYSELDVVAANGFGGRVSALGWYDTVYNRDNDNPGGTVNHNTRDYDEFTKKTRNQHGRDAEIRDAFLFGSVDIAGMPLGVRLGQHSLVWGESLFFANNAIAGAQSPFDITRLLDDPTSEAKEFVLPVPQISAELQITQDLSIGGYYQFRHRYNRIPAAGSYFSFSDVVGEGAERLWLQPGVLAAERDSDMDARDSGQFGLQVRWLLGEYDLGFYALRFHDKDFQQVMRLGQPFGPFGPTMPTNYYLAYHEDTKLYGFSVSRSFGTVNLAMEASVRKDQSLASTHAVDASGLAPAGVIPRPDNKDNPAYAVGDTAHVNVSSIWSMPRTPLWNEANMVTEVAWTRLLKCKQSCDAIDGNATRDSWSMRAVFEPTYRQLFAGWDVGIPMGIGFSPNGSRNILGSSAVPAEGGGDFSIGLSGTYMSEWEFNLAYVNFFGPGGEFLDANNEYSYRQARKDRDFVSFTVRHSF